MKDYYTSYVIVRNPWVRLVSVYQEKVESYLTKDGKPPTDEKKNGEYT